MFYLLRQWFNDFKLYNQRRNVQDLIELARAHAAQGRAISSELDTQVAKLRGML